jgi:AraC family transcriptional regulator of adaptative response / DNA-3-methyladenine glycosylase II
MLTLAPETRRTAATSTPTTPGADADRWWLAVSSGDARFDGWVYCGVTSTGIYCRPSCPARTPKRENVRFYPTAAAAQTAGFRACKRCRPDAAPGSPEWDRRGDLVGRAMRLIADGVVDREGVAGLSARLAYSPRHLHRELVAVAGAGPLALARAQRAQTARLLLETTEVRVTDVAFAAGFQSVRQFNTTVRQVFATTPTELRRRARRSGGSTPGGGAIELRLPYRAPFDGDGLIAFFARRAIPGVEEVVGNTYRRSLRLPHGPAVVELTPDDGFVRASFRLEDLRDLAVAMARCRTTFDLDSDPSVVDEALGADPVLRATVRATPGRRVPGHVDGDELALRTVVNQQVSLAGAAAVTGRIVAALGEPLEHALGTVTHLFPTPAAIVEAGPDQLPLPAQRRRGLIGLARALTQGQIVLDLGADRAEAMRGLSEVVGIGPWTAGNIAMRALRDPDVFLPGDLGVRRGIERLGFDGDPAPATQLAEQWRPYRSYAVQHLRTGPQPP